MTTKRRPIKRNLRTRITGEVIEAYREGDQIRLHRALGLLPSDASPLDDSVLDDCPYPHGYCIAATWETVREFRVLLDAAVKGEADDNAGTVQ